MTDYQWSNDMNRFKEILDAGINVICKGIGGMIYESHKTTTDTYLIYGTTYKFWEDVESSEVALYLAFIDPEPMPF